ncbi:MAG: hypothetical protein ACPGU1_11385 [Myxococcota bacterium]
MFQARTLRRNAWTQRAILVGAVATYLLGYAAIRSEHLLVHAVSFAGSDDVEGPAVASHDIKAGDFGAPMLGPSTTLATLIAGVVYWPVTKAEIVYWNIVEPPGSPYDGAMLPLPDPKRSTLPAPPGATRP